MKNLILMLAGTALLILIAGTIVKTLSGEKTILSPYIRPILTSQTPTPTGLTNLKEITIGKTVIMVSVADTNEERAQGLGGITNLPSSQGMLFTFESKNIKPTFWMKGMLIPLDFVWIKDNKVTEIDPNIPSPLPNTPDSDIQRIVPNANVDFVLEVNAGFCNKNNIKVGDRVNL